MSSPGRRRWLAVGALALLAGCRPATSGGGSTFLTTNDAQGSLVVEAADCKGCKPAPRTFYIVSAEQLKKVRGAAGLSYLGTEAEHHFFRAWNKLLEPPEIDHIAVPLSQCAVTEPHSLAEEHAQTRDRKPDAKSATCVVH